MRDDSNVLTFTSDTVDGSFKIDPYILNQYGFGPGRYRAVVDGESNPKDPVWETCVAPPILIYSSARAGILVLRLQYIVFKK